MTNTTTTVDPDDFLAGGNAPPAFKFSDVGDGVKGDVINAEVGVQRDFATGQPATWPNGDVKRQLMVDLELPDGTTTRLYCRPALKDAIREAVQDAGGRLADGGTLSVKRIEDGVATTAGFNAPHQYKARFEPKPKESPVDDLDF